VCIPQSRDQSFAYDALNRLTSAQNAGTDCNQKVLQNKTEYWGNSYSYDPWGNLLNKTVTKCGAENLAVTADVHNWIHAAGTPDYQYDAAGNMTFNATAPTQTYTYDQENRLTAAAGYTYTYDADGNRVKKVNGSAGTLYWYMTPGIVAESDLNGNFTSEYVFFGGERVARKDFAGGTTSVAYYFSDHLKTASVITDSAGMIKSESDFYPWGGELQFVANDSNHYKFTGKERDSETNLDYFGARYYSNGLGRWVSADWSATPVPVPYADFADPQSLNQYSYTSDIPTVKVDADGHQSGQVATTITAAAAACAAAEPCGAGMAAGSIAAAPILGMVVASALPPMQNTPDGSSNLFLDALNPPLFRHRLFPEQQQQLKPRPDPTTSEALLASREVRRWEMALTYITFRNNNQPVKSSTDTMGRRLQL
jgi:RHS repeat-associated protein